MKKRIALAAVAALAGGLLVAAPASAAQVKGVGPFTLSDTAVVYNGTNVSTDFTAHGNNVGTVGGSFDQQTIYQTAGASNSVTIPAYSDTSTTGVYSGFTVSASGGTATLNPASYVFDSGTAVVTLTSTKYPAVNATSAAAVSAGTAYANWTLNASASSNASITVPTPTAGTITVSVYGTSSSGGVTTSVLKQIYTVTAYAATSTSVNNAVVLADGTTAAAATTTSSSSTAAYADAANGKVANIEVFSNLYAGSTISAVISGSGLISNTNAVPGGAASTWGTVGRVASATTSAADANGNTNANFAIYGDGTSGTGTITLTGTDLLTGKSVSLGTVTVKFYGTITSLTATQGRYVLDANNGVTDATSAGVAMGATGATEGKYTVQLVAKDANGTVVPTSVWSSSLTGASSNSAVLSNTVANAVSSNYNVGALNIGVQAASSTVASGSSATMTYSITAGTNSATVSSAALPFSIGGAVSTVSASFDTATHAPGTKAVLNIMAKDSSGNAAYDGQYADAASAWSSNLGTQGLSTSGNAAMISKGAASVTLYAPTTSGTWTVSFSANDGLGSHATVSASAAVAVPSDAAVAANAAALATLQTAVASLSTTVASLVASMTAQIKVINASLRTLSKAIARIKAKLGIK